MRTLQRFGYLVTADAEARGRVPWLPVPLAFGVTAKPLLLSRIQATINDQKLRRARTLPVSLLAKIEISWRLKKALGRKEPDLAMTIAGMKDLLSLPEVDTPLLYDEAIRVFLEIWIAINERDRANWPFAA